MGERVRALSAPVDHGCVFLRDAESTGTHESWDPKSSRVSWSDDSVLFSVQPSVDGEVEFEIWRGEPKVRWPECYTKARSLLPMAESSCTIRMTTLGLIFPGSAMEDHFQSWLMT